VLAFIFPKFDHLLVKKILLKQSWGDGELACYEGWLISRNSILKNTIHHHITQNKDMTCLNKFEILKQDVKLHFKVRNGTS